MLRKGYRPYWPFYTGRMNYTFSMLLLPAFKLAEAPGGYVGLLQAYIESGDYPLKTLCIPNPYLLVSVEKTIAYNHICSCLPVGGVFYSLGLVRGFGSIPETRWTIPGG
jgi:hypothetical protein